ncbi:helix-turn-helix domain-containing protein [Chitinimonas koreensis]|uniref:helix-turn-helix domain-containing protein n=1 Tax=Chitinimonas koreensis TaxID=356302 RepID=UPI0004262A6C|nr:helix-turn-helix transcriptional regulator [Chitinimonas koreensis]QNM96725.1 helix-turn-helix transcriptional regulator [Chitinimonas koreensis]
MPKSIYREEYRVLVDLLREARERTGITQGTLADAFGWPQSTLSHLERGSRRIDVVEFIDYCRYVGIDPQATFAEFLHRSEKPVKRARKS